MGTKGYKSTEFWLSLAAMILGALMASGVFAADSTWGKVVGLGVSILAGLGYTASRALFKSAKLKADTIAAAGGAANPS